MYVYILIQGYKYCFFLNCFCAGIGPSGAAIIDPLLQTASITIKGSNDPHGVIQFSQNSLRVRTEEANHVVNLQVDRKFGAIGEKILSRGMLQFGERAHKKKNNKWKIIFLLVYISIALKICGKSFSEI